MIDEKEITPEINTQDPLQRIANEYIVEPSATDDERLRKMSRGFFVELDPSKALSDIPSRVGGYKNGERRQDHARERVLGSHPELSFVIATLPVRTTVPTWGNDYLGGDTVGYPVLNELRNMQLSDREVIEAMKSYALKQAANGNATDEAVASFIAQLNEVEPRDVPRRAQF